MKNKVNDYFDEKFDFGGEIKNRRQIIDELFKITKDHKLVNMYLFGLDHQKVMVPKKEKIK